MNNLATEGRILVIAGCKGVGKDHSINNLVAEGDVKRIVSYTTRLQRPGEIDGCHYHFVDNSTFDGMVQQNQLFEHIAHETPEGIVQKGTTKADFTRVLNEKGNYAWRADTKTAANLAKIIKNSLPQYQAERLLGITTVVYLGTDSVWNLVQRLKDRDGCTKREAVEMFRREWEMWKQDGHKFKNILIVPNGGVEKAKADLLDLLRSNRSPLVSIGA